MKTRIHAIAGGIGFLMILLFLTSTVIAELFASHETVAAVKALILKGMFILIPAMIIAGGSGMVMGKNRTDAPACAKKKRMPIIALNGLLVLVPCAWFLADKAAMGGFDTTFYIIQVIELIAGAANLTMVGLNIRDGLTMTGRIGGAARASTSSKPSSKSSSKPSQAIIEERPAGPLVVKSAPRLTDANGNNLALKPVMALCRCGQSKNKPYCDGAHSEIGFTTEPLADGAPDDVKIFEGEHINVHYSRLLCSHAGECGTRLKEVFDTDRDPWIVADNATPDEVREVIKACPSGALSWGEPGGLAQHILGEESGITIEGNGPYRVSKIPLASGAQAQGGSAEKYVLCRCGASKNKPFCDGTHVDIAWADQ
ncbi:MAG: CDGSH iron-sulfur domain-containing protein [Arenicella sp.]